MKKGILRTACLMLVVVVNIKISHASSLIKSNGTAAEDIDGRMLINFGRQLNKPVLTLIGMAIRNLENHHRCDDWTQWSRCRTVREGYIATKKRTRTCEVHPPSQEHGNKTTETDITICEGYCPEDYNVTANGFCVKFYVSPMTFEYAESQCRKDGGHLINIDSELKNKDVANVIQGSGFYVFIDGRRRDSNSPWLAWNGSEKEFFRWPSGEPGSYLCTRMLGNAYSYGYSCKSALPYVCEIVQ